MFEWKFLTSTLDEGEWSAWRAVRFTPKEIAAYTPWVGDLVGPRVGLDAVTNKKISASIRNRTPVVQPVV